MSAHYEVAAHAVEPKNMPYAHSVRRLARPAGCANTCWLRQVPRCFASSEASRENSTHSSEPHRRYPRPSPERSVSSVIFSMAPGKIPRQALKDFPRRRCRAFHSAPSCDAVRHGSYAESQVCCDQARCEPPISHRAGPERRERGQLASGTLGSTSMGHPTVAADIRRCSC